MGLIKDRHGTYYARHKVPERLQAVVARILDNGKARQVWLKKSLGTKVVAQANVRAKPVQMEFDRILAQACNPTTGPTKKVYLVLESLSVG